MSEDKQATFRECKPFGDMLEYPIPDDCDMVLVCVDLHQHMPITILLNHQIYRRRLLELKAEYPRAKSFTVMPYRNADKTSFDFKTIEKKETEEWR